MLDTRTKRNSAIHVGLGWMRPLPLADGTVNSVDRVSVAGFYRISADVASEFPRTQDAVWWPWYIPEQFK